MAGNGPPTTTYIQTPVDLLHETPGLLQIVGTHQLPFQDGEGHLRAWGEVEVFDQRQGDRRAGFVFHPLKLHHFHGGDGLRREGESQREWQTCQTCPRSCPSVGGSQFTPHGFRTPEGPRAQPGNTCLTLSRGQENTSEGLKSTNDELQKYLASFAGELLILSCIKGNHCSPVM